MNQEPSFGTIVKGHRRLRDLIQAELARRVGCAAITIRKIEADALRPSQQIAERLAMTLGIPLDERAVFVRLARTAALADVSPSPLPTPPVLLEEIGLEDLSGRAIRGFALGERLGAGGYGVVYRAVQLVEREVAVKIILLQYTAQADIALQQASKGDYGRRLFVGHTNSVEGLAISPDGKYILTAAAENSAQLWEVETGRALNPFSGDAGAFSQDGKYMLTGSLKTAYLWDRATGRQLRAFGAANNLWSLAISPDSQFVLIGGADKVARLWDIDYQVLMDAVCARVLRNFTDKEREQYRLNDQQPTCPAKN